MNIYQRAIERFGKEHQLTVAIEELAELTKEITKQLRYGDSNIEEELADVKIMISQLEEMCDSKKLQEWMNFKLARLEKLLKSNLDKHCFNCRDWTTSVKEEPCRTCQYNNNFKMKEVKVNE